jgi:hypothetical protein
VRRQIALTRCQLTAVDDGRTDRGDPIRAVARPPLATHHRAFEIHDEGLPSPRWADGGVALVLAENLEAPRSVHIRLGRLPRHVHVEWDGARRGWRGDAEGGGG